MAENGITEGDIGTIAGLCEGLHRALTDYLEQHPGMTYGEIIEALEIVRAAILEDRQAGIEGIMKTGNQEGRKG